jgi:primosomal protein N' (replication factor Y)
LPYKNLKLIVVDEEHDASYKQEDGVMYQARDMAVLRAHIGAFPIILASATPSLETLANVEEKKYKKVELPERFFENALPEIKTVDMRQEKGILSAELLKEIAENMVQGNQTLLFLNRRGYAPIRLCKSCGEKMTCPHCSVCLTEHKTRKIMLCHQCGYFTSIKSDCRACGEKETLISCGMGVERVAEEIISLFPNARVKVVSSDTVSSKKQFEEVLNGLDNKEIDILIGTQMLAKGHHFPDLTLVGVLDADFSLSGGDLRACERTFQLLQQVAGRAGRQHKKGRVLIQTHTPENAVISAMKNGDRNAFLENEIEARKLLQMPPFGRLAALILSGKKEERVLTVAHELAKKAPFIKGVEILGPVQAPIALLRGKYRYRFLIKTPKTFKLQQMLKSWLSSVPIPTDITLKADIDPYSFF